MVVIVAHTYSRFTAACMSYRIFVRRYATIVCSTLPRAEMLCWSEKVFIAIMTPFSLPAIRSLKAVFHADTVVACLVWMFAMKQQIYSQHKWNLCRHFTLPAHSQTPAHKCLHKVCTQLRISRCAFVHIDCIWRRVHVKIDAIKMKNRVASGCFQVEATINSTCKCDRNHENEWSSRFFGRFERR